MRNYLFAFSSIVMVGLLYVVLTGQNPFGDDPKAKEETIIKAVNSYLSQVHYQPQQIDDNLSEKAFDLYLKSLDGNKRFLTQLEIDQMNSSRTLLDDEFKAGTLQFFDQSDSLLEVSIDRAEAIFKDLVDTDYDFTQSEEIQMDPEKRSFAKDEVELRDQWRKILKYDILLKYNQTRKDQEKLEKRIAEGKASDEDKEDKIKSEDELIEEAREEVRENFEDWFKRLEQVRRSDRFESYVNAIIHCYDPHSDYYNPKEKADFDIRMAGKLEGIGARLSSDGDYTKVVSIVPGGPAWKGKDLEVDDLISAVTQEGDEPVNIEGMRLDDVVSKIRGKKGTVVILTVKKPDGTMEDIRIVRDVVITEEGNAKSVIIDMEGVSDKIGYIYLPSFYADFKAKNGRSCAKDIAIELEKLKDENVDGIILDIRNNGGGSLRDVVDMGGLFIEEGPIVQVKPKRGKPYVLEDEDSSVQYDGPLIIMVNEYSVSASEILAAAMQDYKRALIVGSPSTFGKGTVQRFYSLDQVRGADEFKPLGDVKMTIQKFFRINGTSTQLKGVVPDIILPDNYQFIKRGEKDYDYPLEWNEIESVDHTQNAYVISNHDELRMKSEKRVQKDSTFQLILENAHRLKESQEQRTYPLDLDAFIAKMDERQEMGNRYKDIGKDVIPGLVVENLDVDMDYLQADSSRIGRNEDFISKLTKDIYLKETIHILDDMTPDTANAGNE